MKEDEVWEEIGKVLEGFYGENPLVVKKDKLGASVRFGRKVFASLVLKGKNLHLSLRASIMPNDAAMITASVVCGHGRVAIDDLFEFKRDGEVVWGEEALYESIKQMTTSAKEPPEFATEELEKQKLQPN